MARINPGELEVDPGHEENSSTSLLGEDPLSS